MKVIDFGQRQCERVRRHFDAYVSNELLIETTQEVMQHVEGCRSCTEDLEARIRMKAALRDAVKREAVPADLESRILRSVRDARPSFLPATKRWIIAAAVTALCVTGVVRNIATSRADATAMKNALALGLQDHVHCAVGGHYPKMPPPVAEMAENLGDGFSELVPVVQERMPAYRLRQAHHCTASARAYAHVIMTREDKLISLVVARKHGDESLRKPSGSVVDTSLDGYSIAAVETTEHLAFLISNLDAKTNSSDAARLAVPLRNVLRKLERVPKGGVHIAALGQFPISFDREPAAIRFDRNQTILIRSHHPRVRVLKAANNLPAGQMIAVVPAD